jgi:6-methylsalicylate decarboxylase
VQLNVASERQFKSDNGSTARGFCPEFSGEEKPMSSRREFLGGVAALGAGALLPRSLRAQGEGGGAGGNTAGRQGTALPADLKSGRRIDVHHHYGPPAWIKELADQHALNVKPWEHWTPAQAVEDMDRAGVQTSYSSITTPGVYFAEGFGNQQAPPGAKFKNNVIALARAANEYGAKMKADFPGRFGIWASLPLPDADGSLKEIEYAFDQLKLDGIGLMTSIGSKYLGDAAFSPVFEELNRRKAIIYVHGTACPSSLYAIPKVGPTTLEYSHDVARTIVSWIESGSADRFPDLHWIFSHGGGSLWSNRYINGEYGTSAKEFENRAQQPRKIAHLRRFYYDTAATADFMQMQTLKMVVGARNIVFGSDNPYGQPLTYVTDLEELKNSGVLTEADVQNINRENMLRILPQSA